MGSPWLRLLEPETMTMLIKNSDPYQAPTMSQGVSARIWTSQAFGLKKNQKTIFYEIPISQEIPDFLID